MLLSALTSAWWVTRHPRILLLSAAVTVGSDFAGALGGPGPWPALSANAISGTIFVLIARAWCGLAIAATALQVLRSERRAPFVAGVPVLTAIGAMLVTIPPIAPVLVGAFLLLLGQVLFSVIGTVLVIAGAYWIASWSQAGMLMIDGRAGFLESTEASSVMTRGHREQVAGFWALVGGSVALVTWLDASVGPVLSGYSLGPPIAAILHLALRVISDAFCTCAVAAMYYELDKTETATGT